VSKRQAAAGSQSKSPAPAKAGADLFNWLRSLRNVVLLAFLTTGAFLVRSIANGSEVAVAQARESITGAAYRDGPPFGFSGGFGEENCQVCHIGEKLNFTPGNLRIDAPDEYSPGQTYTVTVTVSRPGMKIGGFQLTARFEDDSTQAGTLALGDGEQGRIKVVVDRDVLYAYHSRKGAELIGTDQNRWTLRWTAPAGKRLVQFNAAANAANGDETNSGDFIYTARTRSRAR
jgi:hypothetical protein